MNRVTRPARLVFIALMPLLAQCSEPPRDGTGQGCVLDTDCGDGNRCVYNQCAPAAEGEGEGGLDAGGGRATRGPQSMQS